MLEKAEDVKKQVKQMISRNEVTWAVPNVPLLLHGNSAELLDAINKSVEKKIEKLKEEKKSAVC